VDECHEHTISAFRFLEDVVKSKEMDVFRVLPVGAIGRSTTEDANGLFGPFKLRCKLTFPRRL
jgi:hypothetical protein